MAAQEKAKQGTGVPAPADTAADLLDSFDAPAESESAPPPPFDVSLLPTQAPPPPAFDATTLPPPVENTMTNQSAAPSMMWDPNPPPSSVAAPPVASPPVASAPVFEDLLDHGNDVKQPPTYNVTPVAPPTMRTTNESGGLDQDAIDVDAILGIQGLSSEEKATLIAEQENIMASVFIYHLSLSLCFIA